MNRSNGIDTPSTQIQFAVDNESARFIGGHETLLDLALSHARDIGDRKFFTWLDKGQTESDSYTFGELDTYARALSVRINTVSNSQGKQTDKADSVLIVTQPGPSFIPAFFACQYAGLAAVPVSPLKKNEGPDRILRLIQDSGANVLISDANSRDQLIAEKSIDSAIKIISVEDTDHSLASQWTRPDVNASSPTFIQYTSGSTGTPKGVVVSNQNLLCNEQTIATAMEHSRDTVFVGWVPLFHDMGLIGNLLQPFCLGVQSVMMAPQSFIARPFRWLDAISTYRATTSGGPNFAYELCASRISDSQIDSLDLSSWKVAFNGAEPVRADTLERFSKVFARCGLQKRVLFPCYGLAESTLLVSGTPCGAEPVIATIDKIALQSDQVNLRASELSTLPDSIQLASSGRAAPGVRVKIVNPDSKVELNDAQVGEVWVDSGGNASAYRNQPEVSEQTFRATIDQDPNKVHYLRTGDLGFMLDGELFVTGRRKDLVVIDGRNHYPHDIEFVVTSAVTDAVCSAAAFSVDVDNVESLVVVVSVNKRELAHFSIDENVVLIKRALTRNMGLSVHDLLIVNSRLPYTSSGKLQRRLCQQRYLSEQFDIVARFSRFAEGQRDHLQPV